MKKITLTILTLLFTFSFLTGCKKDDDSDDNSIGIIGKWYIKKMVEIEYENGVKKYEDTDTDWNTDDYIEFKSNGKALSGDGLNYIYMIKSGNMLTITSIDDPNDVEDYQIKQLTSTDLVLYQEETEVIQGKTYKETSEISLKK